MPTYDYHCENCNNIFEVFLNISELDNTEILCTKCESVCKRLVSGGTGIIFKGSGFFVNDYSKKDKKRKESEEKERLSNED